MSKLFHLGDLLSVTDGTLVSLTGIAGVHSLVDFVTGETHLTHQLPRAVTETVRPEILRQHHWLGNVTVPELRSEAEVLSWLGLATSIYGDLHAVEPLPFGTYVGREPIAEAREMNPNMRIIDLEDC